MNETKLINDSNNSKHVENEILPETNREVDEGESSTEQEKENDNENEEENW